MSHRITEICTACGACARFCPVFAIRALDGHAYQINARRCVDCGVCGRVCPVGAVYAPDGKVVARLPRRRWPKAHVRQEKCSGCSLCVDACTRNCLALVLPEGQKIGAVAVLVDAQACTGCAQCVVCCPQELIHLETPDD